MIPHKFRNHQQDLDTEILILGTFHPDITNGADFYYGRPRNYLWTLLPACFGVASLRDAEQAEKEEFMWLNGIDFVDIIQTLDGVSDEEETNYKDAFIDAYIAQWYPVEALIDNMHSLRAVYFTRKTFQGIPNIAQRILEIENYCQQAGILFDLLETPARFINQRKLDGWKEVMTPGMRQ